MQVCVPDHVLAVRDQLLLAVRQAAGQAEPLLAHQHSGRGLLRSAVPGAGMTIIFTNYKPFTVLQGVDPGEEEGDDLDQFDDEDEGWQAFVFGL